MMKAKLQIGEDATKEELVAKLAQIRDEKLAEFIPFHEALKSGTADSFASLPKPVVDFEIFKKRIESFYVLSPLPEHEKRKDMQHSCSCPVYQDHTKCKHSIREGVATGKMEDETKKSIEKKHKRGRSKKSGCALEMEDWEYHDDSSDNEAYKKASA